MVGSLKSLNLTNTCFIAGSYQVSDIAAEAWRTATGTAAEEQERHRGSWAESRA